MRATRPYLFVLPVLLAADPMSPLAAQDVVARLRESGREAVLVRAADRLIQRTD